MRRRPQHEVDPPRMIIKPLPKLPKYGELDYSLPVGPAHDPVVHHAFPSLAQPGDIYINPSNEELAYLFTTRNGWEPINYAPEDFL